MTCSYGDVNGYFNDENWSVNGFFCASSCLADVSCSCSRKLQIHLLLVGIIMRMDDDEPEVIERACLANRELFY